MKLHDILAPQQQLDELNLKQAIAAGMIGVSSLSPNVSSAADKPARPAVTQQADTKAVQEMIKTVSSKHGVDPKLAGRIVRAAHRYEHQDFPKAEDILAVIGVESRFKPNARSHLAKDPAVGLMQIRPGIWNLSPQALLSVENNIKHGSDILRKYYTKLQDEASALQAYNVGITAFKRGKTNHHYLRKVRAELAQYEWSTDL
ncbi:lytic transglycosylase domain-containing protein [Candidatus Thorarchaeota archaeon]|nr:MAG: lytic transglycosylase domain-containing protein [Candidatus Thorarchaeota archaeon]